MKKLISIIISAALTISLCACGDNDEENEKTYENFKIYVTENGIEEDYYIQISKTADSANTLIEASKFGNDCAFMEYDASGTIRYYRNNSLTLISAETLYMPNTKDAQWENFEFEALNEKYENILSLLLETNTEKTIEKSNTGNKKTPYKFDVKFNPEELDTKSIFSNNGDFGIVSIKFETDENFKEFGEVSVSCQYNFDGVIYLYSVTFGEPNAADDTGKNGQRPENIQNIYEVYASQVTATE